MNDDLFDIRLFKIRTGIYLSEYTHTSTLHSQPERTQLQHTATESTDGTGASVSTRAHRALAGSGDYTLSTSRRHRQTLRTRSARLCRTATARFVRCRVEVVQRSRTEDQPETSLSAECSTPGTSTNSTRKGTPPSPVYAYFLSALFLHGIEHRMTCRFTIHRFNALCTRLNF